MFSCIYLCFPYTISCCFLSVCKHCLCICGSSNILYGKLTTIHIYAILYTPSSLKLFLVLWAIVVLSVICPWVHKQLLVHEIKFSFIIQCLLLTLIFAHSKYVEISSHDSTILSAVNSDHDCTETLAFVIINRTLYHTLHFTETFIVLKKTLSNFIVICYVDHTCLLIVTFILLNCYLYLT